MKVQYDWLLLHNMIKLLNNMIKVMIKMFKLTLIDLGLKMGPYQIATVLMSTEQYFIVVLFIFIKLFRLNVCSFHLL